MLTQKLTFRKALVTLKEYTIMTLGMFIYSFGWIGCVLPAKSTGGAASGLAIVISTALHNAYGWEIQIGTIVLAINAVLLVVAGFVLGWNFGLKTIYCIVMLSMSMNMWQSMLPPEDFLHLDRFLSMVLGGVITGFGVAMAIMQGGSAGGTDIVATIVSRKTTLSIGRTMLYVDFCIISSSYLIFHSIDTVVYGLIILFLTTFTCDQMINSNRQAVQFFIISNHWVRIADAINLNVRRGCTVIDGQGWYSKHEVKMLVVVARRLESVTIFRIIKSIDPHAFITQSLVTSAYGQGFDELKLKPKKPENAEEQQG